MEEQIQDQDWEQYAVKTPTTSNDEWEKYAVKKKGGGDGSVNGMSNISQFVSPSKSISTKGIDLVNNNLFKEISQPVPPELQKRHEEILNRVKQLNAQPKIKTPIQTFDNMAASILGFNRDLVQSINPKKVAEIEHDVKGHWGNIVQNVFANIEKAGTKLASGALQLISDMEQGKSPAGVKMVDNPMDRLIAGLNGNEKRMQRIIENNPLPNTFMGNAVESLSSFLPDIMGAALLPEAKIAQGAGLLKTTAAAMFGNFTKYMAGKGLLEGYGAARQEGKNIPASVVEGVKESGRGALIGMEMGLLGLGSGMATNAVMKKAAEAGLTGAKGIAAKELINLATDVTAYGLVSPTVHAGIEGRFPDMKDISEGTGIALLFRMKGTAGALKNHIKLNKALEETQNLRQGAAISNFVDADIDAIKQVYEMPETATELNIKAFEAAKKAKKETDLHKKQQYVAEAILNTKAANVKSVTERILESPETIENLKNSEIPENLKEQLLQKAQEVTDLLKSRKDVMRGTVSTPISKEEGRVEGLNFENAKEGDIINHNGESVIVVGKTKTKGGNDVIEVKKQPKTDKELEEIVWGKLASKYSEDYPNGMTLDDAKKYHGWEFQNLLSDAEQLEGSKVSSTYTIDKNTWDTEIKKNETTQAEIQQPTEVKEPTIEKISENIGTTEKSVADEEKISNLAKQTEKDANDIIAGNKIFERFSPSEQQGIADGGKIHAEATILVASNEGTGGKNNSTPEAQENRVEQYAKDKGIWTDDTTSEFTKKYGEPIASGEEAIVWGNEKDGNVIKTQDTFQYDNLQQKLDGITLHNSYFPEAPLKVLGFGRNSKGEFQIIVEQPFIKGEKLTPEEIKNYLEKVGFKEDENGHFSNKDTIIEDVHTGNAIKTPQGNIIVIDPIMRLNTEEQGYGGERKISNKITEKVSEAEPMPPGTPIIPPISENSFMYEGSKKQREYGLLNHLVGAREVPEGFKKGLKEKGLQYEAANQYEASESAKGIIASIGRNDAMEAARTEMVDPSVGSAIYGESLNDIFKEEQALRLEGKNKEADVLAKEWADTSYEYAQLSNKKGKWNAQIAYFYKSSPMGVVMRINSDRSEQFKEWFKNREEGYKEVFDEIIKSEEGQVLLKEEVEKLRKEERKGERKKRDKAITDFFEKAKMKGGTYATIIPPPIWNGAIDIMAASVKAGDRVVVTVQKAIEYIDKNLKEDWDRESFKKEYEEKLGVVVDMGGKESSYIESLDKRKKELERRISEKDFSAEEYKSEKDLSENEKKAKKEYEEVKKLYDEAKKISPEYIDKKAKQYLNNLRKRLSGLNEKQKEDIVRRSIKKIIESGGLQYDEFKDIVSDVMGIKKLSPESIKRIEELTDQVNAVDQKELDFLNNPTKDNLTIFKKAKEQSLQADRELFELIHNEADIVGTLKSIAILNLLSLPTLVKNYAQSVIYQGVVRFPSSLVISASENLAYYSSMASNRLFGTKMFKPTVKLTSAQKGYFREYNEGVIRGWNQMIKGVDEKDYFAKNQYASPLNPSKSLRDLKSFIKGDLYLTTAQKIDKGIQATLGWQPYVISRGMIYGDKPPRYAAQGAAALQIAHTELNINDPIQMEAFILSPEKYSYNHYVKAGMDSKKAGELSKGISDRIVSAGAKATFQNENYLNDLLSKIDDFAKITDKDRVGAKIVKPTIALGKAFTLPFIKTPANIMWAYFKMANPTLTLAKSIGEHAYANDRRKKGDIVGYREYQKKSKESFAMSAIGYGFTLAAVTLAQKGLIRTSHDEDDKARESAGEAFFGKNNQLNLGKLLGVDDMWVDLSWFSAIGTILDTQARIIEDKRAKGETDFKYNLADDFLSTLTYSAAASLNTLVFDQGAKTIDAIRKGGNYFDYWSTQTFNTFSNIFTGGTLPSISKALLPEKSNLKADNLVAQIINNQKQRNIFIRWAAGYPPSKISMWGEPIKNDKSIKGVIGQMLGFELTHSNKFGAILYDDQQRTGLNEFFPPVEDYKIKVNGKDVKITTEEKKNLDIFIGQQRKALISPFLYDKLELPGYYKRYSDMKDEEKIDALKVIYDIGKKSGFLKFKEKYKQYQDSEPDVNKLGEKRVGGIKKGIFKLSLERKNKF